MANRHRGESEFVAGEDRYRLRFDINAICEAEDVLGKSIVEISETLADGKVSMTLVRGLLWAGLRGGLPTLTLKEAGDLIEAGGGMFATYEQIGKAMALAFPADDANPTMESSPAAADGNGLDS